MIKRKNKKQVIRRVVSLLILVVFAVFLIITEEDSYQPVVTSTESSESSNNSPLATEILDRLEVKGRAPKTGYSRDEFGSGWGTINGCDTRNVILQRDLKNTTLEDCLVMTGTLNDPYTGQVIEFTRGVNSSDIQIDHVVALSDAWQKGAQYMEKNIRKSLANDPLNLLAVDGPANQQKGDGDAATWLPSNKSFRCEYVARQVSVKHKYSLWVTQAEKDAIHRILTTCPNQTILE